MIGFENLVFAIFEFVHALVDTTKFKPAVKSGLSELMYYIVLYMQITEEQVSKKISYCTVSQFFVLDLMPNFKALI